MSRQDELFSMYPDVLGIKNFCEALGIGRAGAYKLLASGEIKCFKIGNTYKIPKSSLLRYVKEQCNPETTGGDGK